MLETLELQTAIWIYDVDNFCITWANKAALSWWESPSLTELQSRDFEQVSSQAVKETLKEYQKSFHSDKSYVELWQFLPKDISKEAYCRFSGVKLPDGRMAMLVEATPSKVFSQLYHEHTIVIVASFDMLGEFQSCNPQFEKEFGDKKPALTDLLCTPNIFSDLQRNLNRTTSYESDIMLNGVSGSKWFRASFNASKDLTGNTAILCQLHNIDERKKRELKFVQQAHSDSLTGLLNRRGFSKSMQQILDGKEKTILFYIDLDGFKMINDSLGHAVGDLVLKEVANRLVSLKYKDIKCCRFGGDEFVVSLPDNNRALNIDEISATIVNKLSAPYIDDRGNFLAISASIGVAHCPKDSRNLIELIRFADSAMYCSKKQGKKRSTVYVAGMEKEMLRKSIVTQYLSNAIARNELSLHYQPIVDALDNTPHSFEALIRWHNPKLGQITPLELIEVAEQAGLIVDIENWVIATAISNLKILRQYTNSKATIAINISSIHIVQPELVPYLLATLTKNNLLPSDLIIEITESVLLDGLDTSNNPLRAITTSGINVSIDDFGTGYSSLAYLHNINASSVKIDRNFIKASGNSVTTLKAIHTLITSLNMVSIVEGIETQTQANIVTEAGINMQQGFWYQEPKPLKDYRQAWTYQNTKTCK